MVTINQRTKDCIAMERIKANSYETSAESEEPTDGTGQQEKCDNRHYASDGLLAALSGSEGQAVATRDLSPDNGRCPFIPARPAALSPVFIVWIVNDLVA